MFIARSECAQIVLVKQRVQRSAWLSASYNVRRSTTRAQNGLSSAPRAQDQSRLAAYLFQWLQIVTMASEFITLHVVAVKAAGVILRNRV